MIEILLREGMNICRLNCSHMNLVDAERVVKIIKEVRCEKNIPLAIMLDTKGPEVRIYGHQQSISLSKGDEIVVNSYTKDDIQDLDVEDKLLYYTNLPRIGTLVSLGQRVLLMDGYLEGVVTAHDDSQITLKMQGDAKLRPKAHLSIPNVSYPLPFLTEKDKNDIIFAVKNDIEYLALSFVQSKEDLFKVRNIVMDTNPHSKTKLIAKIENGPAIEHMDEIIHHSDGIMVARGDLGVELPLEDVPVMQKEIIKKCYQSGKPVITATQMLESMIDNRLPTRAEASDVANACYDLTSCVMLSGETAIGNYPDLVVRTMKNIILRVEDSITYQELFHIRNETLNPSDLTSIICYNAVSTAHQSGASAIIVFSKTGYTARMVSRLRPGLPVLTFVMDPIIYNQLALNWGIQPYLLKEVDNFEELIEKALELCSEDNLIKKGESVVIVAGLPLGKKGKTNMIRVETVGKFSLCGKTIHEGQATSPIVKIVTEKDLAQKAITGKIVLLKSFKSEYIKLLKYVSGIIMETDTWENELKLLGMAYDIPIIVNLKGAWDKISEGNVVEFNTRRNLIVEL
jgi:pyruvate kinase